MGATDTSASSNGRGSDAWLSSWTHFHVDRRRAGYCRVTFDHAPIDEIASRLARFDHDAIARTKSYVAHATLPADSELVSAKADSSELPKRPAQQARLVRLEALGLNADSDLKRDLGRRVVDALNEP